jgi:hypothetical protein
MMPLRSSRHCILVLKSLARKALGPLGLWNLPLPMKFALPSRGYSNRPASPRPWLNLCLLRIYRREQRKQRILRFLRDLLFNKLASIRVIRVKLKSPLPFPSLAREVAPLFNRAVVKGFCAFCVFLRKRHARDLLDRATAGDFVDVIA